jgi:nitrite reductase/ring-hydroxylating ferredoxin subunit
MFDLPGRSPLHRKASAWPVDLTDGLDIVEGEPPRGFLIQIHGDSLPLEGMIWRGPDGLVAYENQCRHWPVLLDFGDGDFLSPDKRLIQCRHHGALYDPQTGACIAGPCIGARLRRLEVTESDGRILVAEPHRPVLET